MSSTRFIPKLMTMLLQVWMMTMGWRACGGTGPSLSPTPFRSPFSRYPLPLGPPGPRGRGSAGPGRRPCASLDRTAVSSPSSASTLPAGRCHDVVIGARNANIGQDLPCRARERGRPTPSPLPDTRPALASLRLYVREMRLGGCGQHGVNGWRHRGGEETARWGDARANAGQRTGCGRQPASPRPARPPGGGFSAGRAPRRRRGARTAPRSRSMSRCRTRDGGSAGCTAESRPRA